MLGILAVLGACLATAVVQTEDDRLHFLGETVKTYDIPFGSSRVPAHSNIVRFYAPGGLLEDEAAGGGSAPYGADASGYGEIVGTYERRCGAEDGRIAPHRGSSERLGGDVASVSGTGAAGDEGAIQMSMRSRIDSVYLAGSGYVIFEHFRIPLAGLYSTPFVHDGMHIFASSTNAPHVINSTFILITTVLVRVYDLVACVKKDISFSYLNCPNEGVYDFEIRGSELVLDDRAYELGAAIVAVYYSADYNGLRYLTRLYEESVVNTDFSLPGYASSTEARSAKLYFIGGFIGFVVSGLVLALLSPFISARPSVRTTESVSDGVSVGVFVQQPCVVYRRRLLVPELAGRLLDVKNDGLVSILYSGKVSYRAVLITELTRQFLSRRSELINYTFQAQDDNKKETPEATVTEESSGTDIVGARTGGECYYLGSRLIPFDGSSRKLKDCVLAFVQALEFLHGRGLVHGCVCPENMRITEHGSLRIQCIFRNDGWQSPGQLSAGDEADGPVTQPTVRDDIFSMGCTIHYFLTGHHPFESAPPGHPVTHPHAPSHITSPPADSDQNILSEPELDAVTSEHYEPFCSAVYSRVLRQRRIPTIEANILGRRYRVRITDRIEHDLVYHCIFSGDIRISRHPYFWDWNEKMELVCDFSDFILNDVTIRPKIERLKPLIFRGPWSDSIDASLLSATKRTYNTSKLVDLVRFIRNSYRHSIDIQNKQAYDRLEGGICQYFLNQFPRLFMAIYKNKHIRTEDAFKKYFE